MASPALAEGRAADQEVGDHVGQNENGVEGVGLHAASEQPSNVFDVHQADDARMKRGDHEQDGGREDGVRMGGMQQVQSTLPPWTRRMSFYPSGEVQALGTLV
jgi:hypothetical protein